MFRNILFASLLLGLVNSTPTVTSKSPGRIVTNITNGYTIVQDKNASCFSDLIRNKPDITRDGELMEGNPVSGTMFDVLPTKDISIQKLYLNLTEEGPLYVELWTRTGTHVGYEMKPWKWQRNNVVPVDAKGRGKKTDMDVGSVNLKAGTRYGFYLMVLDGKFRHTNGNGVGDISTSNEDLTVYAGSSLARPFNKVCNNRIWDLEW